MIIQNAYMIPDGRILLSENDKTEEFFDIKTNKSYYICGGKSILINNCDAECIPLFLTDDSSLSDIKSKLVWRTYEVKTWERNNRQMVVKRLIDLKNDHLKALLSSRHLSNLYKYIIGMILMQRRHIIRN